ncbi:MAG: hypothetical protein A2166_05430 [Omnitrophica WOR_2 bacterium RBG_13_41_10]|nr:MAG: hypothetical protein A2166_05430 [Omnitrophica WOR_2 bacterium RBG_13_41_10]
MKKTIFITLMVLILVPALAFAEEKSMGMDTSMKMAKGMEMGKGMGMGRRGMGFNCGKMCMMMQKQMVVTSDGGVIVLAGNKLYKYDKNLNLVKEVEIKIDVEAMKKTIGQMREKCNQMMQEEKKE